MGPVLIGFPYLMTSPSPQVRSPASPWATVQLLFKKQVPRGVGCSPDPSAQHGCGSEVGSAMPPRGPVTWCRDAQPSPGQARPWLQRGPLIAQLRCSAQPFILPENISVRVLPSGCLESRTGDVQSTASQSSQCARLGGLSTWWEIQTALQRGRMPTVRAGQPCSGCCY